MGKLFCHVCVTKRAFLSPDCCVGSAAGVVVSVNQVGSLGQLGPVDRRFDNDEGAEHVPEP